MKNINVMVMLAIIGTVATGMEDKEYSNKQRGNNSTESGTGTKLVGLGTTSTWSEQDNTNATTIELYATTATPGSSSTLMTDLATAILIRTTQGNTMSHGIPPSDKQPIQPSSGPESQFDKRHRNTLLILIATLILICAVLLAISVALASQVCHLRGLLQRSHRTSSRPTRSNADLVSNSGYWAGTNQRTRGLSETEASETSILMRQLSQTQQGDEDNETKLDDRNKEDGLLKLDKAKANGKDYSDEGKESRGLVNKVIMNDVQKDVAVDLE